MGWLDSQAVQGAIANFARPREVKLTIHRSDDRAEDFGFRQQRFHKSDSVGKTLKLVGHPERRISMFVGTNRVEWTMLRLPPPLRVRGVSGFNKDAMKEFRNFWKKTLTREGCQELQINFETIYQGKDLVWDVDYPNHPGAAFGVANDIAKFLESKHGLNPQIVFSGSKGFHVWLHAEEAESLVSKISPHWKKTFATQNDPLRYQAKLYRTVTETIYEEAASTPINYLDLAPIQRQGVIRCPYSIHPKTGQVVWPLDAEERTALENLVEENFEVSLWEIITTIHPWTTKNEYERPDFPEMGIHPATEVWQRGMPMWNL